MHEQARAKHTIRGDDRDARFSRFSASVPFKERFEVITTVSPLCTSFTYPASHDMIQTKGSKQSVLTRMSARKD